MKWLSAIATIVLISLPVSGEDFTFDGKISKPVLKEYLSHAVTHAGLLASSSDPSTETFDEDLAMLRRIGAKFIGRAAFAWDLPADEDAHFAQVKERAGKVHAADPEMILQAAVFEIVSSDVDKIAVPAWVFEGMSQPVEKRNFDYETMCYDGDKYHNRWRGGASVPDMSKLETRLWFYYRAVRYLQCGVEAIHFGQVKIMDDADPFHRHWIDLLTRIRLYARENSHRHFVLCDAHTHGISENERLLFDFHSYPMRLREIPGEPMEVRLTDEDDGDIFGRSLGGITPSGWYCDALPYLVEFDNYGYSGKGGESVGGIWVWGYDEISWFAHLSAKDQKSWLHEAHGWVNDHDSSGSLQLPTRRLLASPVGGKQMFNARDFDLEAVMLELLE